MKKYVLSPIFAALLTTSATFAQNPAAPQAPTNMTAPPPVGLNITKVTIEDPTTEGKNNQGEGPTRAAAEALKKTAPAPTAGGGK